MFFGGLLGIFRFELVKLEKNYVVKLFRIFNSLVK